MWLHKASSGHAWQVELVNSLFCLESKGYFWQMNGIGSGNLVCSDDTEYEMEDEINMDLRFLCPLNATVGGLRKVLYKMGLDSTASQC